MNTLGRYFLLALLLISTITANAQIITTVAGIPGGFSGYTLPPSGQPATAVAFSDLRDVVADHVGNIYVTDAMYWIYKIGQTDTLSYFAEVGGGIMAIDEANNVYTTQDNKVLKVAAATGVITTVAGTGTCTWGWSGDGGPATAADICLMSGIAVRGTTSSRIYLSQGPYNVVRQVYSGTISAFAGYFSMSGSYSGDGGSALGAQLNYPEGMALDPAGNLYICDNENRVIRKVSTSGIITTYAGNEALLEYSGDGGPATAAGFLNPVACATDSMGNLYVVDYGANVIRKINAAGIITTFAGNGTAGYGGDNGPAAFAQFNGPLRIAADHAGNVYVIDLNNIVVRKISATSNIAPAFAGGYYQHMGMCVDAAPVSIDGLMSVTDANPGQNESWAIVTAPSHGVLTGLPASMTSTGSTLTLSGATYTPDAGYIGSDTFKISITDDTSVNYTTIYVSIDTVPGAGIITGLHAVCVGANIVLSDAVTGGIWSMSNTNCTVAGGIVTGVTAGMDTVIYAVTNSCATTVATLTVTINPITMPGPISGSSSVCTGSNTLLTDLVSGGVWSVSNGNASISPLGVVTGISVGVDTIRYTITLGSCPSYATTVITINTIPTVPFIIGPASVCIGDSVALTSGTAGVWSISNANATVSSAGYVTGISTGTDTVFYTVTNSCGSASGKKIVTVRAAPSTAGTIAGPDTVCVGNFITLSDSLAGGTWSSSDIALATVVTATGKVTGQSEGVVTITYKITNFCGSAFTTYLVDVGCNTGIIEPGAAAALRIYPNPNNGNFRIDGADNVSEPATIVVYDLSGKEILRKKERISRSHTIYLVVPAGVYLLTVSAEHKIARATVVIN